MARLPDINVATWAEDQINEFHKATSGYLDSLFFDDQTKQQEAGIPPDFDAPGGMDQWEQVAIQRRTEELRRQQEEEQRRIEAQQAQEAQAHQAAQAQQAQDAEQARVQQEQASTGMLSSLGIPSPEEAFSGMQSWFNRPADNVSSTGVLDAVPASSSTSTPRPESSVDQFTSWAQGLTEPLLGRSDSGSLSTTASSEESLPPASSEPAPPDHTSTSGIFDTLGQYGQRALEGAHAVIDPLTEAFTATPVGQALTTAPAMGPENPHPARAIAGIPADVEHVIQTYGLGSVVRENEELNALERDLATSTGSALVAPNSPAEQPWRDANPEKAARLDELRTSSELRVAGSSSTMGGGGLAGEAINAIKALRAAGMTEAAVNAERELAMKSTMTLEEIQKKTGALVQRVAETINPNEVPNPSPLTAEEQALNAAADAKARAQPPHAGYLEDPAYGVDTETGLVAQRPLEAPSRTYGIDTETGLPVEKPASAPLELGQEVITPDEKVGKIGSRTQFRINGKVENRVSVYHPDGSITKLTPDEVRPSGRSTPPVSPEVEAARPLAEALRKPTPEEAAIPRVLPEAPTSSGPARPGGAASPLPTDAVASARSDGQLVEEMLHRSRGRSRQPVAADVQRVLNGITSAQQSLTDKLAKLEALGRYIENLRGSPLQPHENAWLLARVYEGRDDAALLRMERMLQDPLTQVGSAHIPNLERVAVQLDNVGVDWLARMKERSRVEATIPSVRARQQAPASEVRRTGEAVLEQQRAQANLRATEREWIAARNERNALLKEMDATGAGPTQGVETTRAARRRAARGEGPSRSMETGRSMSAQERLERVNVRLETAKARRADAQKIVGDLVADKRTVAEAKTRIRAVQRSEQVGEARQYSGGASPQKVDAILQALVEDVGPQKAQEITDGLDALYRYRDAVRDRLVESGIWSKETGAEFKGNHPYYIPTKILEKLDEQFLNSLPTGSRTFSSRSDLIKHITPEGTTADRMTPIRSILEMGFQGEAAARRNEIMKAVAGWADAPEMGNFIKRLKKSQGAPVGYTKMSAMVNGEAQSIAIHNSLADSLKLNNPGWTGILGAAVKGATFPLRAGATALRPAFIATNAVNDAGLTLFRFAAEKPWYDLPNPISRVQDLADLFRGYHLAMGAVKPATRGAVGAFAGGTIESAREGGEGNFPWNDPDYWKKIGAAATVGAGIGFARGLAPVDRAMIDRFRASGASMGMQTRFHNPDDIVRQLAGEHIWVRKLTSENDLAGWLGNRVGRASDVAGMIWSRPLGEIGSLVESAPRYAAFGRAERETRQAIGREIQSARKQGFTISPEQEAELHDALLRQHAPEIANKARRVTADFAAGGSFIKTLNQMSPFLNASTQALVEAADMTQKNAPGVAAATAAIVAATIYSEIYNRSVAPDDYKNVSEFTKNTGLVILSDKAPEGEGKRGLVYIPTRGVVGALVPLTKAAMGNYFGDDPRTWKQLAADVGIATINQMSPVNADVSGLVGMFVPPIASQIWQGRANYDAFRDQPIVSRSMEGLPTSEQYDDRTSQFARHLARSTLPLVGGHSPMMTDWMIRGVSPGPGEAFLSAADNVIKATGQEFPSTARNVPQGARDEPVFGPVIGRFLRTVGSAEQNRAYQLADELAAFEAPALVQELEASSAYQNSTPDRQQQMMRSLQNALQQKAQTQAGVEPKSKDLGLPQRWNGIEPGSAEEKEIIEVLGTPARERTRHQAVLASRYQGRETRSYSQMTKQQRQESDDLRRAVGR